MDKRTFPNEPRHLHYDGPPGQGHDVYTLCGYRRYVPFRTGSRVYYEKVIDSVHVSKARKTDCEQCRREYRKQVHAGRAGSTPSDAATATGMYDHDDVN